MRLTLDIEDDLGASVPEGGVWSITLDDDEKMYRIPRFNA